MAKSTFHKYHLVTSTPLIGNGKRDIQEVLWTLWGITAVDQPQHSGQGDSQHQSRQSKRKTICKAIKDQD